MGRDCYQVPNGYQINNIPDLEEITYKEKQRRREREEDEEIEGNIDKTASDGLGVKWGVRDLGLGRNSTMKEMKEIREEETGKRGREKRRPLTESYDLNHNTRRLYRNHFWDPLFHRIIPIQEQRWKLENIWRRKRQVKKSYLCELRNRVNMANKSKVLMIYDKRERKVGFHIAPGGDTGRKKKSSNLKTLSFRVLI
uniref:Uncharacterized protein n=1 Tax=Solanum demissum TaxID=50514 RepID=Q6L3Q1_SOLDE|nr:hypothetical protein SDM1_42t00014 [Solanum demissum]